MIRGAIAFGLVLHIDEEYSENRSVIVSTSLALVVFTTVVFGSTVGLLSKCLFDDKKDENNKSQISVREEFFGSDQESEISSECDTSDSNEEDEEEDEFKHPNRDSFSKWTISRKDRKKGGCKSWLKMIDISYLRPHFIRNFDQIKE